MKRFMFLLLSLLLLVSVCPLRTSAAGGTPELRTGYEWSAEVLWGTSVHLNTGFCPDFSSDDGSALTAVEPGDTVLLFRYSGPGENDMGRQRIVVASVSGDMSITTVSIRPDDMTEARVAAAGKESRTALLITKEKTVVSACFPGEDDIPADGQNIRFFALTPSGTRDDVQVLLWENDPDADDGVSGAETEPDLPYTVTVWNSTLTAVAYSCSGDEYGNRYSAVLHRIENGSLELEISSSPAHNQPLTVKRYSTNGDVLDRILAVIRDFDVEEWSRRPDWLFVCDAPHPFLTFRFCDPSGQEFSCGVSGYIQFTPDESNAWSMVLDIMFETENGEHLIEKYSAGYQ